jgi:hypothetical protein
MNLCYLSQGTVHAERLHRRGRRHGVPNPLLHSAVDTAATRAPGPPAWAPACLTVQNPRNARRVPLCLSLLRIHLPHSVQVQGEEPPSFQARARQSVSRDAPVVVGNVAALNAKGR